MPSSGLPGKSTRRGAAEPGPVKHETTGARRVGVEGQQQNTQALGCLFELPRVNLELSGEQEIARLLGHGEGAGSVAGLGLHQGDGRDPALPVRVRERESEGMFAGLGELAVPAQPQQAARRGHHGGGFSQVAVLIDALIFTSTRSRRSCR